MIKKTEFDQIFGDGRDINEHSNLFEYWIAPSGEGEQADNWEDKPHRLLYDLIAYAVFLENKLNHRQQI